MTLTEFLTARLDEDEAVARAASADPQWGGNKCSSYEWEVYAGRDEAVGVMETRSAMEFTARYDPARVLAEVEAKRPSSPSAPTSRVRGGVRRPCLAATT